MRSVLRNRDFARLFLGRVVTNLGDSLYFVAAMWLVWDLTGNEFYSGLAGFLVLAPSAVQFAFGPLVDRWDIRRLLVATQAVQAVLVLVVPLAALTGHLTVWLVMLVMPALSLLNQVVYPAQSAALPRLVEQDELVGANSLFAMAYQGADAVANAIAGLLIVLVGAISLFVLDAATFVLAAALFASVRIPAAGADEASEQPVGSSPAGAVGSAPAEAHPVHATVADGGADETRPETPAAENAGSDTPAAEIPDPETSADGAPHGETPDSAPDDAAPTSYLDNLGEGIGFLRGTFLVLLLVGSALINFSIGVTIAVLPSYGEVLGGPEGYGFLMASLGAGLLVGSLSASLVSDVALGRLLVGSSVVSGLVWLAAVAVGWLPATVALFLLAFVPVGATNVLLISVVQAAVPERLLGRVTAVLGSASAFAMPLGALGGGAAAAAVGPVVVMGVGGVAFCVLGGYFAAVPSLRRLPAAHEVDSLARGTGAGVPVDD